MPYLRLSPQSATTSTKSDHKRSTRCSWHLLCCRCSSKKQTVYSCPSRYLDIFYLCLYHSGLGEKTVTLSDNLSTLFVALHSPDGPSTTIRVDTAPGFRALRNDPALLTLGITLEIGRAKNINKNVWKRRGSSNLCGRLCGRGGGVAIYVNHDIPLKIRDDLNDQFFECLWVTIRPKWLPRSISRIALGCAYLPPSLLTSEIENFYDYFITCYDKLCVESQILPLFSEVTSIRLVMASNRNV